MGVETWRPIPGYEGIYEVSDIGRVRTLPGNPRRRPGIRIGCANSRGYMQIWLTDAEGRKSTRKIHTLVMLAFVGPRPEGKVVCHYDDDKTNNRLSNLRYDTERANAQDAKRNGHHPLAALTHCKHGHELSGDNVILRTNAKGWTRRECRPCGVRRAKATRARARAAA